MKLTNLKIYYLLLSFNNLWFITSSWLFFWLKYMTIGEVGIIDSIAFLIGILFEFPSGLISDKYGRKITLLLSNIFQFVGSLLITIADTKYQIGVGFIIFQLGVSLFSGTIESFGYESSVNEKVNYEEVLKKSTNFTNISFLFSLVVGGFLYNLNNNLPNILLTLNYLISFIFCFFIIQKYINLKSTEFFNFKNFFSKFSIKILFYFIFLLSLAFCFDYGFLKLVILNEFVSPETNYIFIGIGVILGSLSSNYLLSKSNNFHRNLKIIFLTMTLLLLISFVYLETLIPLFFAFSFMVIYTNQLFLKYVNNKLVDSERAGAISFFNFLYKIPYVFLAVILGFSLNEYPATLILGYIGLFSLFLYILVKISLKLSYNRLFERGRSSVAE